MININNIKYFKHLTINIYNYWHQHSVLIYDVLLSQFNFQKAVFCLPFQGCLFIYSFNKYWLTTQLVHGDRPWRHTASAASSTKSSEEMEQHMGNGATLSPTLCGHMHMYIPGTQRAAGAPGQVPDPNRSGVACKQWTTADVKMLRWSQCDY